MWLIGILIVLFYNYVAVENRMLPIYYETEAPVTDQEIITISDLPDVDNSNEKSLERTFKHDDNIDYDFKRKHSTDNEKKPCAIIVLSNTQNPTMQSLLRKYRYDANGILIPSSVKYFIKSSSILVPLNDKAFSPLGGFVRYYKEVPPIPHAW